ncbi:hypothetical protein LSM04_003002 [Trypanosoma melophagium]|uniref:uncharacterized protein n=1 Tax=Trypanosoma melophagium TaxID=715481 RepID=UPI00351A0A39|nr:hypothetical protein LSM04_003002 [Trypanosoma melophagium]
MAMECSGVEARLVGMQSKLEAMHADIRRLFRGSLSGPTSSGHVTPNGRSERGGNGSVGEAVAIGRSSRLQAASPTGEAPASSSSAPLSLLPAISPTQPTSRVVLPDVETPEVASGMNMRRKAEAARKKLQEFVKTMRLPCDMHNIPELRGAPCTWLLSIALACSYVSGENITIEDVLRQNRLAMHYVSLPSVTLAELFDVTNEYLSNNKKLNEKNVHCEVANFDTATMDEVGDVMCTEERLPITALSQFRKELSALDIQSITILNYDPYLVEQHEIRMRLNYLETNESEHSTETIIPKCSAKNQGTFALLLNFNSALHSVTIGTPYLLEDGSIGIQEHTIPVQTLYKALCVKDNYCNRSRGFVRVFISNQFIESVPSMFPLNVLDGSLSGGMMTTALDTSIAPHILGLSLMHHLVTSTFFDRISQQSQSITDRSFVNLRGIPVTKLCQELGLGITTIVGGSNKSSVASAFSWYHTFLKKIKMETAVALGVVIVSQRGGAEDGPVNIADDVFMKHLALAVETESVLLIGFDVNIALNVKVDNRPEPCHFAIVIGLDQERGVVRLADVNVKKYRKRWHVPVTRLYSAVIGYGYIMAAKSQKTVDKLGAKEFQDTIFSEARYALPPTQRLLRFEYPKKNYVATILADAFDRLGFTADVESVINNSGFHVSFMLSEHLALEDAATVARNYSRNHAKDSVSVLVTHMDKDTVHANRTFIRNQISTVLRAPKRCCLIVNFQFSVIQANKSVWNGSNGGSYAIVLDFDETTSLVTLSDTNNESFYRTWVCPLDVLYEGISAMDPIALRARGTLLLTSSSQDDLYVGCYGYDLAHSIVHHPFKPTLWPAFRCLALVATEMGSDISNTNRALQFSAEDFLYSMPSFSVFKVVTGTLGGEDIAALANTAFERLNIALEASVVDISNKETFLRVCRDESVNGRNVTMTLVGYDTQVVHGVAGFSVGVINRVRDQGGSGSLQLVEGNSCTFGSIWERKAVELQPAVSAMVRIKRRSKRSNGSVTKSG